MSQGKSFWKLVRMESRYMLLTTLIACVALFIQGLFKKRYGEWLSFFDNTINYKINYFMYFIGIVFFLFKTFELYKRHEKSFTIISEINIVLKIIAWLISIFEGIMMIIVEYLFFYFVIASQRRNLGPINLIYYSIIGMPAITVIFLGFEFIRKSRVQINEETGLNK